MVIHSKYTKAELRHAKRMELLERVRLAKQPQKLTVIEMTDAPIVRRSYGSVRAMKI